VDKSVYERFLALDERHFWRRGKRELVLEWLRGATGESHRPLRLLDVGGATSLVTREMAVLGDVTVVEPEASCVALLAQEPRVRAVQGGLPGLPVSGPFDVITLLDVLEHLDDDLGGLRELRSLLRPGGLLLLTVPAYRWLWSEHDVVLHHRRRYTRTQLIEVLRAAELEVLRSSYYTSLLLPLMAAQRLKGRLATRAARATDRHPEYDVKVPAAPLNATLSAVMRVERSLLARLDLPAGGAIVALCRRCP
jgi:SAM-dependent methyltransferase